MSKNTTILSLCFVVLVSLFPLVLHGHAQGNGVAPVGNGGSHTIQGQVYLPSGRRTEDPIQVKLTSYSANITVPASAYGSFTFQGIAPGNYTIVADAGKDYEPATESVFIDVDTKMPGNVTVEASRLHRVTLHLRAKRGREGNTTTSTVDALPASVPENARKAFESGVKAGESGDAKKAVDNLKSAVSIYPSFPQAMTELGVQYLKLGQPDKAAEVLTGAVKLTPDAFRPNLNLGIALLETKQFDEAASHLKTALQSNNASPTAHMYLGISLISLKKLDEAQSELEAALTSSAPEVARAHYYLGGIYWGNREYDRAAEELETYLKLVPKAADAAKVRQTINELRGKK
jgi:Tfp pilus assembly protein PilF